MSTQEDRARLRVELVTPEGPAYADEAAMVIVPGVEGELGVLARHAPIVAQLEPGETRIRTTDDQWRSFATGTGYFKMQRDTALVLVSSAVPADDIDTAAAQRDADEAREQLQRAEGDGDERAARRARRALRDAENRLAVAR